MAPRPIILRPNAFRFVAKISEELTSVALPHMEDCHQYIEGCDAAIVLTNGTGCLLGLCGDASALELLDRLGIRKGAYCSEGQLGTSGLALALLHAMPMQVVGAEHYFQALHTLTTSAAPIHDVHGRIKGIVAIISPAPTATSHTLALAMATARAIGNQLQTDLYLEEANRSFNKVNTILNVINEAVIALDGLGKTTHLNPQAARLLCLDPVTALGKSIAEVLPLPAILATAIQTKSELHDFEVRFEGQSPPLVALVNSRPIFEGSQKPIGYIVMLRPIEQVRRLVHQQTGTQAGFSLADISATSAAMRRVLRQAEAAARSNAPVLLRGEGGVGKNPLGRAIHDASERADKPFLIINCRAIPHELMISEFLGYEENEKDRGRPSKFELAHEGTLMLEHIESLSLEMQSALLHLIETGQVMRLRSTRQIPVNVKVIASTSANIEQLVAEGSFSRQLYYAFFIFTIHIAPLRDRVEDIPALVERALARWSRAHKRKISTDDDMLSCLCRYPWPGNVRELEGALERAVAQCSGGRIAVADLPEEVRRGRFLNPDKPNPQPAVSIPEAELEAIINAGWACKGRVNEMARLLKISRTTLWRKMAQLDIRPKQFKG